MGQQRKKIIEAAVDLEKLEKAEKQAEETAVTASSAKPKEGKGKTRSRKYKSALNLIDKTKFYSPKEAISIIKKISNSKFDETIEAHINLNLSKEKADQQIRTTLSLSYPVPSKKEEKGRILVFASKNTEELKKLGAEIGDESTLKDIEKGKVNFTKVIADTVWMPKLAKVAKILGPKGLMPNPKSGTVTDDPVSALKEFSKGKIEIRTEGRPIIHTKIGKSSFDEKKLEENFLAIIKTIQENKPANFKGELFKSIYLSSTMGPSVKINLTSI